jgi:hypothetical protein
MTAHLPDLGLALLPPDDLPAGWVPTDTWAVEELMKPPSGLCGVGAVINSQIADAEVDVAYRHITDDHYVGQMVARWAPGRAAEGLAAFRAQILPALPCSWRETGEDGGVIRWEAGLLPLPALGDETLAFRITSAAGERSRAIELAMVRRGGLIAVLVHIAIGGEGATIDDALAVRLAARADARLALVAP